MNKIYIILGAPLAIARLIVAFVFTFLCYISVALIDTTHRKNPEKTMWFFMGLWSRSMLIIAGIKLHVEYEESVDKPALILSNHRSYIDVFINLAINPSRIIAKKEIAHWPMFGHGFRIYDTLIIDRSSMTSRINNIKKMEKVLLDGNSLIIYPEGTTHRGPEIGPIKESTYRIASNHNIRVFPVAIEYKNPDDAWVGNDLFIPHYIRRSGKLIRHASVKVGRSIQTTDNKKLKNYVETFMQQETLRMRAEFDGKKAD